MNLHILPDSKFTAAFYENMKEAGLLNNNSFVVRTNAKKLKYVTQPIPFAPLYSAAFDRHIGNTATYKRVYIHQLAPLMYRWIANHKFRQLNWMTWGTDLYNLPFVTANFYEKETSPLVKQRMDLLHSLYLLKVYVTAMPFKRKAYSKVDSILTWMNTEFEFARTHVKELHAGHQYFFYENQVPYEKIDTIVAGVSAERNARLKLIIGNSGTPTNNHLDAIRKIHDSGVGADLYIPVSYGDASYIRALKKSAGFYTGGEIYFLDSLMKFEDYVSFLHSADALVMNHLRPQGYGNIFMMMYMNKPVFLNKSNISLPDLARAGLTWGELDQVANLRESSHRFENKQRVVDLLSHTRLLDLYRNLFG